MSTLRGKNKIILTGHNGHERADLDPAQQAEEALQEFMAAAQTLIKHSPPGRNGARFLIEHPVSRIKCMIDVRWSFEDKSAEPKQES